MALEVTKPKSIPVEDIDMRDKREYRITIGIRNYWITEEEKNLYLGDVQASYTNPSIHHVALRSGRLILPVKFQDIVHRSAIDDSEKVESGRWECEHGVWHRDGAECYCNIEMIETEEGTMRLQEKSDVPLLESVG